MKREDLLKDMKESVGTKDPVVFFDKMVDEFNLLFDRIDALENISKRNALLTALAIHWDPNIAADMLATHVNILRQNKDVYHNEISLLKDAYTKNVVTQNYADFTAFWVDVLGYHPFLDSR